MSLLAGISVLSVIEVCYQIVKLHTGKTNVNFITVGGNQTSRTDENHALYLWSKYFGEFIKKSDIHGLGYTQNQSKYGKIFWTILVLLSAAVSSIFILDIQKHAETSPVLTKIDSKIWTLDDVSHFGFSLAD